MLVSDKSNWPSPFILPLALAVTTVPLTVDPATRAGLPRTLTGCASVARKVWPVWLVLELRACSVLIVRTVPAGTTMGWGLGFSTGGGGAAAIAGAAGSDVDASGSIVV